MKSEVNFGERREHPRLGLMAELENITYSILRKHGVVSEPICQVPEAEPIAK